MLSGLRHCAYSDIQLNVNFFNLAFAHENWMQKWMQTLNVYVALVLAHSNTHCYHS